VVNKDVWNSWSPADQKIVREAAIEAGKREIVIARKGVTNTDDSLLKDIEGHGVKVTTLSPAQISAFAKVTQPVFDKWAKQIGPALVKQAQADIAKR
jgi:TRAP-type C4-dicarboxylate transport system substrate-binding protein